MFSVILSRRAQKDYDTLPVAMQTKVLGSLHTLEENPYRGKKLSGERDGQWSLRVWPYRILYSIQKEIVTVTVVAIGHRQGVYKRAKR